MQVDLKGKVTLVTGGTGAIGSACVLDFAKNGSNIVIIGSRNPGADKLVEKAEEFGIKAVAFRGDVSSRDDMRRITDEALNMFGKIDILINNAGVNVPKEKRRYIHEFYDEEWDRIIAVDLNGTYNCSKPILKTMVARKYGKVINISSIVGIVPLRNQSAFAAAKAGVINLTKAWAIELAEYNINVNVIAPGSILFEGTKELFYGDKKFAEAMNSHIPMGHPGEPADISNAALFLASDTSKYITGALLTVDGGWTCGFARDF